MELADVTDSKSVGSNTVRVRPPPSAPKKAGLCLNRHSPAFLVPGGELALCGSCKDARWRSHKVAARCSDPNGRNSTPRHTSATTNRHNPAFLVLGGELALCGSCKDARWRSHRVGARTRRPQRPQFDNPPHFRYHKQA